MSRTTTATVDPDEAKQILERERNSRPSEYAVSVRVVSADPRQAVHHQPRGNFLDPSSDNRL